MGNQLNRKNRLQAALHYLLCGAVLLPVGMVFLFVFGRFFTFFGNLVSASVLDVIALTLGFFWFLDLVSLLLCLTILNLKTDDTCGDEDTIIRDNNPAQN